MVVIIVRTHFIKIQNDNLSRKKTCKQNHEYKKQFQEMFQEDINTNLGYNLIALTYLWNLKIIHPLKRYGYVRKVEIQRTAVQIILLFIGIILCAFCIHNSAFDNPNNRGQKQEGSKELIAITSPRKEWEKSGSTKKNAYLSKQIVYINSRGWMQAQRWMKERRKKGLPKHQIPTTVVQ